MSATPGSGARGAICIRPAHRGDVEHLVELERRCFPQPWSHDALLGELVLGSSRTWIALRGERPVGYAIARRASEAAELLRLGVAPEERRRSVATTLVAVVIETFERAGTAELQLEVREDNRAALELYRRLGFRLTGRRRGYYEDRTDALLLDLELRSDVASRERAETPPRNVAGGPHGC